MIISRECDYAVRVIRALSDAGIKPVGEICLRERIPLKFAYKILKKLENREILTGHRGPKGGYELSKRLEDITLYDIAVAVDNEPFVNECMKPGFDCPLNAGGGKCGVHRELRRIQGKLEEAFKEKSMAEILAL